LNYRERGDLVVFEVCFTVERERERERKVGDGRERRGANGYKKRGGIREKEGFRY
jgi:hypothetical protein